MSIKNGDAVFFKRGRKSTKRKDQFMEFKGHGFGIFLGHVPPFQKDPTHVQLLQLMGSVGFVSFDDVGEFLGEEQATFCVAQYEKKYYPKTTEEANAAIEAQPPGPNDEESDQLDLISMPETPKIIGLNGKPLET